MIAKLLVFLVFVTATADAKPKKHKQQKVITPEPSVALYNVSTGTFEYSKNIDKQRPLASMTKLMTAMVSLNYDKNLDRKIYHKRAFGSSLPSNFYSRYDLLNAMLVRSDNGAAETIANDYPGGRMGFLKSMNDLALHYEMINTSFDDPSGLSAKNVTTAIDAVHMMQAAQGYWFIRETSVKKQIEIESWHKKRMRTIQLNNTNRPILFEFDSVIVSKTGFTSKAGYCVGLSVVKDNRKYIIVVLGMGNKNERLRTVEKMMYNHVM